jgi:endonuclease/exonuclease/phosphatase family metal-dependent hydrolase
LIQKASGFRAIIQLADPDVLLLNELGSGRSIDEIASVLRGLRGKADTAWNINIGAGGDYNAGAIISRYSVSSVPKLDRLPYPATALAQLKSVMDDPTWRRVKPNLDSGIAIAAGIIQIRDRGLLAVSIHLQCCGPDWQERRRLIEVHEIRSMLQRTLTRLSVDGIVLAGDFNVVNTSMPLAMMTNPYPPPHFALVPVPAVHLDGMDNWTWDGRGSQFPSRALDFSLYSPASLESLTAVIINTEDLSEAVLSTRGLETGTSRELSDHLPIIVDYKWRTMQAK